MLPIGKGAVTTYPCDPRIPVRLLPPDSMKQSTTLTFLGFLVQISELFAAYLIVSTMDNAVYEITN